jgi:FG-GAP-like repeat
VSGSRVAFAVTAVFLVVCGTAQADWSGDGHADVLVVDGNERLLMYRGNGAGGWVGGAEPIGSGWGTYTAVLSPGDFSGDDKPDLIVRRSDGRLLLYRGNGAGGFLTGMGEPIGSGWQQFSALFSPGDFSGDGHPDVLAARTDGGFFLYHGNGAGAWVTGVPVQVGSGWQQFDAIFSGGDFSGDGKPDVIARQPAGGLFLYEGNGAGGWTSGIPSQIGSGWQQFTALAGGGDFSGDGKPDVLAQHGDGRLLLYEGNGAGGWISGVPVGIGTGWAGLAQLTLATLWTPPPPPPPPPSPPSAPLPDGRVRLTTGIRCTPPGGRLRVSLRVRRRPGRAAPRVLRVRFFARGGPRRVDRRAPYVARLPMKRPAGSRGRVYARVYYRRAGSDRVRKKTVSRRFVMCR